jgi:hypothetical protein
LLVGSDDIGNELLNCQLSFFARNLPKLKSQLNHKKKLTRLGFPDLRLFTPLGDDAVRVGRRQRRRTRGRGRHRDRIRDGKSGRAVQMERRGLSLQFPSCMIGTIANAVCRFGEELAVIVEREGARDAGFDRSRGEGDSVCRKGLGKRSRACMVVMEFEALVAERAVQQLAVPDLIGGGVCILIHFLDKLSNCELHCLCFQFASASFGSSCFLFLLRYAHFLDCRHIRCSRSNPLLHTGLDSSNLPGKGLQDFEGILQ